MPNPAIFEAHSSYVISLLFTPDSETLVSAGMDNLVKLWSVPTWELIRTFEGHANSVNSISLSPDGKTLVTGSTDATVKLWSFPQGQTLHTIQDRKKTVAAVEFSPDGEWLAAGSYGGRVALWTPDGELLLGIQVSKKNLSSLAFSPDCTMLAASGLGDEIHLYSLPDGEKLGSLAGHETAVGSLKFIQEGRVLVSLGYERSIRFWDTSAWQTIRTVELAESNVRGLVISPDERRAGLLLEGKVQLRWLESWGLDREFNVGTKAVSALAFSTDGRYLAAGAADRRIRVWELA